MARQPHSKLAVEMLRQVSAAGLKTASAVARLGANSDSPAWSLFREGLSQHVAQATRRKYSTTAPWVQPSPIHFEGLPATVLNVPADEVQEFLDLVVDRYVKTLRRYWVDASVYAFRNPGLEAFDDREMVRIIEDSPLSRFLCPRLDERDRQSFARIMGEAEMSRFLKLDLSAISRADTLPGIYLAPTVTLLERVAGRLELRAIRMGEPVFTPADGAAWELARYFVLQGAAFCLLSGIHPTVHFPMDAINALTKSCLPVDHPVRRLLEPHCFMQLPLNYAVLYIDRSVAHNEQREIYTPMPSTKDGFFGVMRAFYEGMPGNSAYPAYRFSLEAPVIHSHYGGFLGDYFDEIATFCRKVTWGIRSNDVALRRWAEYLSAVVPGFPGPDQLFHEDALARTLAAFITDVSVIHSADHYGYARESIRKVPLRLRRPPPRSRMEEPLNRRTLVTWEDLFRHRMAREMYFRPNTLRHLIDVAYLFAEPRLQRAAREFREGLRKVDTRWSGSPFIPLSEIASSIQY